ncbi:MAG: sigma-70 family RNA polymerase sigma factor [Pirellulales bacterium]
MDPTDAVDARPLQSVESLLRAARDGSEEALGRLTEACRQYLLAIANQELPSGVRAKAAASDLVQDTFLEAQRDFLQFHGEREDELLAWLRRILRNNLASILRRYRGTSKRDIALERSLDGNGSSDLGVQLAADEPTPSRIVSQNEQVALLESALTRLPAAMRQVVEWRYRDRLKFQEIGKRMNRSPEAARKLLTRAIDRLQQEMAGCDERR